MKQTKAWKRLSEDLTMVEDYIEGSICTLEPLVTNSSLQLLQAGGKRIRPAFALLSARLFTDDISGLMPLAAALEMIHMASLTHDDIIDNSMVRRGKATINAMQGSSVALHIGDFLTGQAMQLVDSYEDVRISLAISSTIEEMCLGELYQLKQAHNLDQGFKEYLYRIQRKTALLMAVSCQTGGLAAGAGDVQANTVRRFGYCLGIAFQIIDDVLDMVADKKMLGKPVGGDLKEGNITLPVLYALANCNENEEKLRAMLLERDKNPEVIKEIISIVKKSGGLDYALNLASRYTEKAKNHLICLPDKPEREFLMQISDWMVKRSY